jgi:hypothetical protein
MSKRILIYALGFLAVYFLVAGYSWFRARQLTAAARKQLGALMSEETAQKDALAALGNENLDPKHFALAELEQKLHQPNLRQAGAKNTTSLGWACGGDRCAIWASFPVPFGQEIPPALPAAALIVNSPGLTPSRRLGVGGIYLGEPVEEMLNLCRKRACVSMEKHRMRWSEDWNFIGADTGGKIALLVFLNEKVIQNADALIGVDPSHFPKESSTQ